jgi:hypothetical protein
MIAILNCKITSLQSFQMSYKFIPNSSNVALKFESVMKVPILNACALIYETQLFNKWVPFCKISKAVRYSMILVKKT